MGPQAAERRIALTLGVFVALLLLDFSICRAAELVTDEALRLHVLHRVFPNAAISISPVRISQEPREAHLAPLAEPLRSALEQERNYDVVGPVAKDEEAPAEQDITRSPGKPFADRRQVRLLLYRSQPNLVAVVNYSFPEASPSRCCRVIGKVMLLSVSGDQVLATFDNMPNAFTTFTAVKFIDVGSTATEELLISVDFAGAGTIGINTAIFDLSSQKITPLGWLTTAVYSGLEKEEMFTLTLDEQRTRLSNGRRCWFTKKTYI